MLNDFVLIRLPDHRSVHVKLLVKSRVALLRLLGSIASLRITKVSRIDSTRDVLNYDKLRTLWRV